ncbi:S41 family peptidase [Flavobacterium sp.]|uniref:S41 family peptidase n=1 Tax=Flavobacterium sp. TaxID=239 RepID=UPI00286B5315|nr:S41 family peptidase [Flavobacterium sp.]
MIKKITIALVFLVFQFSFSQNTLTETNKLAATSKVWGFLKYYHPKVANGEKNWDQQLFDVLPKIEHAKTKEEISLVLENWIDSLGEVKKIEPIIISDTIKHFDKNFDLSWIDKNKMFSKKLLKKLKFIENNRFQGEQYYIKIDSEKGNALEIINEIKYSEFKWDNRNSRILTLFRYWNLVEYFFPYKYMTDQNWNATLIEMLPRFINTASELDFHLTIKELVVKLDDSHASFGTNKLFERFGDKFIPANIKIIEEKVVITSLQNDSLAKISDLRVNDVITKVAGKTIKQIIKENQKYVEGSNQFAKFKNFYWAIFNGNNDSVEIEFIRDGKTATKTIKRYLYQDLKIKFEEKEKFKLLENNIGYVDMGFIEVDDIATMMNKFKDTKAIIFDIRNYPNETLYAISEYLNPEPKEYIKFIYPDLSYPSKYIWTESDKCGKKNNEYYKGKVIILIDENTMSQAEQTAMCFQVAPQATIIGSQTAGADGNKFKFEIIKGFRTSFTGIGVFYPNKKETQRIGIIPNIKVKPTILGITQGKDKVLDRAIKFIETGK